MYDVLPLDRPLRRLAAVGSEAGATPFCFFGFDDSFLGLEEAAEAFFDDLTLASLSFACAVLGGGRDFLAGGWLSPS